MKSVGTSAVIVLTSIWSLAGAFLKWVRETEVDPPAGESKESLSPIQYDGDVTEVYLA
jgi:hypothetical protein